MRNYSDKITLIKNSRGVYDLDTSKGCYYGMLHNLKGCYGDCYAAKKANIYGYDFKRSIKRDFEDSNHIYSIRKELNEIDMPFVRIGVTSDPSHDWKHTIKIINLINDIKPVVVITKHWISLSLSQLNELSKYNVIFNTSISAIDDSKLILNRLNQYNIISNYCKSILRIVSCYFGDTLTGLYLKEIQNELFENKNIIDTVLRVSKKNNMVKSNLIQIQKINFLGSYCYASIRNKNTYLGYCDSCPDMCGINI